MNNTRITVTITSSMTRLTAIINHRMNFIAARITAIYSYSINHIANYSRKLYFSTVHSIITKLPRVQTNLRANLKNEVYEVVAELDSINNMFH